MPSEEQTFRIHQAILRSEGLLVQESLRAEIDRILSDANQPQPAPWETVAVPCEPMTLETLRRVERMMRRDDEPSVETIVARKTFLDRRGRRRVWTLPAVCRSGRSSAYVFHERGGFALGLNMLTMKDCDERITWDSEGMAKAKRYA